MTCVSSKQDTEDGLLLATGSQDSLVRLWRVEKRKEEVEKKEVEEVKDEEKDNDDDCNDD